MGFDDGGGTSNVVVGEDEQPNNWDRYVNNHVVEQTIPWADDGRRWESSARRRCNPYEITPFTSYDEQTRRDFFMDSYHDEDSDEDSPSNDSEDGNVDENDDNNAFERDVGYSQVPNEGTSSQAWRQGTVPDNIQADRSIICEDPPFFSQVYDEQIPDSTDLPYASRTTYYNPERGDLCINMIFKDKKELIASVKDYSVRVARREYRVVQSSPTFWKVCCKNKSSTMPCHWGLRASLKVKSGYWKITKYGGSHTCISSHVGLDHHNMDINMVANTLVGIVRCDPSYEIKYVMQLIKDKFGYNISYHKAWHSLRRSVENVYGTWESSVRRLPRYMGALVKHNPGSIVEWNHIDTYNPTVKILNYVFWAFRPCIDGFEHCRTVISINGTHLYTKYKHKMLIAVGLDANNQVLPLAFSIVDEETYDSWKWFLDNLSKHVIRGARGICLISDRHRAIVSAVDDVPDFKPPRGVHRFCLRHVCSNFNNQFKNVHLKDLCWRAGTQHQIRKFDATMDAIKNLNPNAYRYLCGISREKWTMAHDGGWRRGVMTTNMSECLDGVLKGARRLPISAIVQLTIGRCVKYFFDRKERITYMVANNQPWPDFAFHKYEKWSIKSSNHSVSRYEISDKSASVVTRGRLRHNEHVQVVNLSTRDCSCGKWTIFGIPCSHAICTTKWYGLDPMELMQPWFSMHRYVKTYEGRFIPIPDEGYWDDAEFELNHNQC
ncbi:uncharacterized protein [Primulina huaijiensis]|uniref:uncharacterized protein n=1 Tax=Primulina huaijiensis TaxID=1492673 RepID=UPI003CC72CD8